MRLLYAITHNTITPHTERIKTAYRLFLESLETVIRKLLFNSARASAVVNDGVTGCATAACPDLRG
jgi:hypothetical protein